MRSASLFILIVMSGLAVGCGKTSLALKLNPGDSIVLVQEGDKTIQLEGKEGAARHQHSAHYRLDVVEVLPDAAKVRVTIDDMTTNMDVPDSWGSGDQPEETIAVLARGLSFEMTLSPDGNVQEIRGADEMVRSIAQSLQRPGLDASSARVIVEQQFGREALEEMFQNLFAHYPGRPVREGSRWSGTQRHSTGMPFLSECMYTLAGLDEETATIAYTAAIKPNFTRGVVALGMQYTVSGSEHGTLVVDRNSGWTLSSDAAYRLESRARSTTTTVNGVEKTATVAHGATRPH